ncbi:MAG: hypothetical protein ACO1OO_07840 [Flavisolibacter sp.]
MVKTEIAKILNNRIWTNDDEENPLEFKMVNNYLFVKQGNSWLESDWDAELIDGDVQVTIRTLNIICAKYLGHSHSTFTISKQESAVAFRSLD